VQRLTQCTESVFHAPGIERSDEEQGSWEEFGEFVEMDMLPYFEYIAERRGSKKTKGGS
jgi:hypothetical protein